MLAPFDLTTAKQVSPGSHTWVTPAGAFWQKVNDTHPERRQWVERKLETDKDGYFRCRVNGRKMSVQRWVYEAFVGQLVPGLVVCHMDNNRTNNHFTNLQQQTQAVNISHKRGHGTHQAGEKHPCSKYSAENIRQAKTLLRTAQRGPTGRIRRGEHQRIADATELPASAVRDLHSKGHWACVE